MRQSLTKTRISAVYWPQENTVQENVLKSQFYSVITHTVLCIYDHLMNSK